MVFSTQKELSNLKIDVEEGSNKCTCTDKSEEAEEKLL